MTTRLISDELDLNLSSLASRLVIIVVVVVSSRGALAFDTATIIAVSEGVVIEGRGGALIVIGDVGHCEFVSRRLFEV